MRIPLIAVAAGVVAGIVLTGAAPSSATIGTAAGSAPSGSATLTQNEIYRSSSAQKIACSPTQPRKGSAASIKQYLRLVARCNDVLWTRQFTAVGWRFSPPRVVVMTTGTKSPCGRFTRWSPAHYCPASRTIYFRLLQSQIKDPFPLVLAKTMAHEYGHHVQQQTGIFGTYWSDYSRSRSRTARNLLNHRLELQAECFSGVFLRATEDHLPVVPREYDYIVDWTVKNASDAVHGTGRNQVWWLERGFNSTSPAACNTWAAPNARVA
ncbi:neutral zinc metallopeptidase [Microtetraspora sp. NBRC 16547]|uniref:neutral zinc metallopeptidase n=1 Tax=Microtetraspora sp. NBRC 16547 TaxID=3030993 RepID=UPI0025574496|nr:neutral zinc metallopeptidase [Microtetraspora sp. NBRC 16547]